MMLEDIIGSSPVRTAKKSWFILNQDFLFRSDLRIQSAGRRVVWVTDRKKINIIGKL